MWTERYIFYAWWKNAKDGVKKPVTGHEFKRGCKMLVFSNALLTAVLWSVIHNVKISRVKPGTFCHAVPDAEENLVDIC